MKRSKALVLALGLLFSVGSPLEMVHASSGFIISCKKIAQCSDSIHCSMTCPVSRELCQHFKFLNICARKLKSDLA